jgi:hypothetical protein
MTVGGQGINPFSIWIGLPFGLVPLGYGAWTIRREFAPAKWLKVTGTIVASKVEEKASPITEGVPVHVPAIEYEYAINSQTFKSSRRRLHNYISGERADADAVVSRYPAGASVIVFVNPRKPGQSVLEYGVSPLSWVPLAVGLLFLSISLLGSALM